MQLRLANRFIFKIAASALLSLGILWLLLRERSMAVETMRAIRTVGLSVLGAYVVAQLGQGWFRALRYRILLMGAGSAAVPSRRRMFLITLGRNMLVDLLPARAGELGYWALLKREGVAHEDCLSSMTVSVWLDMVALLLIMLGGIIYAMAAASGVGIWLWSGGVLLVAILLSGWLLFYGLGRITHLAAHCLRPWPKLQRWAETTGQHIWLSFRRIRYARFLALALWYSILIRLIKYAGLLLLFKGMAATLSPELADMHLWQILLALIAAEGVASIPAPTFMSFGTYESGGALAMRLWGGQVQVAAAVLFATHVASQLVDYSLGGLGLLTLLWQSRNPSPEKSKSKRTIVLCLLLAIMALAGAGMGWCWWHKKGGATEAPPQGERMAFPADLSARLQRELGGQTGWVIWSSNMFGQHDLVRLMLPSLRLERLTDHLHVDGMPKISPDGTQIAFVRSRQPWVSFRNMDEWDVWMLDVTTGEEKQLAEFGTSPTWSGDGSKIVFSRRGKEMVELDLMTGTERLLFSSLMPGLSMTGPHMDPQGEWVTATVRGLRRSTSLFAVATGEEHRFAGGCQLTFTPDGKHLTWIAEEGAMKNSIWLANRDMQNKRVLLDMPAPWSHEYFPRVSNDGKWLAFGASTGGHEHDVADYEIFLWKIGSHSNDAIRISFHTGNDNSPDVWIQP